MLPPEQTRLKVLLSRAKPPSNATQRCLILGTTPRRRPEMAIKNKIKIAMKSAIRAAGFELKRLPKHRRPADRPKARAGDAKAIEYDTPLFASDQFRIEMAASCRDADNIPKVEDAGAVVIENGIPVQIMHNGVRVIAGGYHGEWMMELIKRLRGHHE